MRRVILLVACCLVLQLLAGTLGANAAPAADGYYPFCGEGTSYYPGIWPGYRPGHAGASFPYYGGYSACTYQYAYCANAVCCVPYVPVSFWWEYPYCSDCCYAR